MNRIACHSQVPFKGKEEFWMVKAPVGRHVLREEKKLFQSLSHQANMPSAIMPKSGIKRDGHTINLQHGCPGTCRPTYLGHQRFFSVVHRVGPSAPMVLCLSGLFISFRGAQLPFLGSIHLPFLP